MRQTICVKQKKKKKTNKVARLTFRVCVSDIINPMHAVLADSSTIICFICWAGPFYNFTGVRSILSLDRKILLSNNLDLNQTPHLICVCTFCLQVALYGFPGQKGLTVCFLFSKSTCPVRDNFWVTKFKSR